jgi:hypothetical protein
MRLRQGWIVAVVVVIGLAAPACTGSSSEEAGGADPATVEPLEGSGVAQITLSSAAARRLDVQTAPVSVDRADHGGKPQLVVPYDAVLYDPNGDTWVYTATEPLAFVRAPIAVDRIEGERTILSSGPPAGTEVVTVGASELLGVEYEVGEE